MRAGGCRSTRGGQIVLMLSVSMFVLFGMLGMVVDLGGAYFTQKAAQAAADAAALAAVRAAMDSAPSDNIHCGLETVGCAATPVDCSLITGGNLRSACLYAQRHGFFSGNGRDRVAVQAWDRFSSPTVVDSCGQGGASVRRPPTAGCVDTYYWVTVRVSRTLPRLFSAVLSKEGPAASARATAAVTETLMSASIYGLNRQNEVPVVGKGERGNNLYVWGGSEVRADGIVLASTSRGLPGTDEAGVVGGAGRVYGGVIIRGGGWVNNETKFVPPPVNGFPDLPVFDDPMRGKGQPPAPRGLPAIEVPDNNLAAVCPGGVCRPGAYYVTRNGKATGEAIKAIGPLTFASGNTGFGDYVFFGGLEVNGTVYFAPGRYVLAGSTSGYVLRLPNNAYMTDFTPRSPDGRAVPNSDAGEIFIFTDANYPGLEVPPAVQPIRSQLKFGQIYIQSGDKFEMNLHGLNRDAATLPDELKTFAPTVFWQDQRNSPIKYDQKGHVDYTSCGSGSLDNPCPNNDPTINPGMILQASPKLLLYGLIYQPRGAGIEFQGNAHIISPLQIITGSVSLQGGNTLELPQVSNRLRRRVVTLVE